jgi:GTPase
MVKDGKRKSALSVTGGVEQPDQINTNAVGRFKKSHKKLLSAEDYTKGILQGNRTILSMAITLAESALPSHQDLAQDIIKACLPYAEKSIRIGITGVPGVGKSTFIEAFGTYLSQKEGRKIAILAIDPSSERSKGSILGDKTRMEALATDPSAFIRPSPSGGTLGGVARKTRETIVLCEAAGFDTIFIETVGVGQSETAAHSMVDFFLLLMLAGAGDELQGIKRGIMEMADLIAINKADGNNIDKANIALTEYKNALHLFPLPPSKWSPQVLTCSAKDNIGIREIWSQIKNYSELTHKNGYFGQRRNEQSRYWMNETIQDMLKRRFSENENISKLKKEFEQRVMLNEISSFQAAQILIDKYFEEFRK